MNEAETRAEHIDPALQAAGQGVVEGSKILREPPITPGRIECRGRRAEPLIAEYVKPGARIVATGTDVSMMMEVGAERAQFAASLNG